MPTILRDVGMGYKRSIVIRVLSIMIGLPLGLCGVMSTLMLVTTFDFQLWVLVLTALLWLSPLVIAGIIFMVTISRRTTKLDSLFAPLGLTGSAYMSQFRQYHGTVHGRGVHVYLWRGPFLVIDIDTTLRTRLGITEHQSDTSFAADLMGKHPLVLSDPDLAALSVFAHDEAWTRALLSDSTATDALRRLTVRGSSIFTRQQVILRPGTLTLMLSGNRRMFGIDIAPEQTRLWIDDLIRVIYAAEALPAPQIVDELTSSELLAQKLRNRNPYMEVWIGLGMIGLFVVIAIVIFAGVFLFTGMDKPRTSDTSNSWDYVAPPEATAPAVPPLGELTPEPGQETPPDPPAAQPVARPSLADTEIAVLDASRREIPDAPFSSVRVVALGQDAQGVWWIQAWSLIRDPDWQGELGEQWFMTFDGSDWNVQDYGTGLERTDFPGEIAWEEVAP